ncbi:MAG: TolC family protein [Bacteroidetes bacterium]|nr:TolC family protein [Bacteroidota bacterium]
MQNNIINKTLIFFLLTGQIAHAQPELNFSRFRQMVLDFHPIAKQADLFQAQGQAALLEAKGGFDPKTSYSYSSKNFNGDPYFDYNQAEIKLPTWLGLELKGSYNTARGKYLNSESRLPGGGQAAFGFNWTLGQGLLVDERRTNLRIARVGLRMQEAQRAAQLNDLMLEASKAYWSWVLAFNQLSVFQAAFEQSSIRLNGIRESFLQGDKPAIDTVETFAQVQNRKLDVYFAQLELQNTQLALQNFLWQNANQTTDYQLIGPAPRLDLTIENRLLPLQRDSLLQSALIQHPEIRFYEAKIQTLQLERRWKNEKRKPELDLSYYLLGKGWQFNQFSLGGAPQIVANDIKFGIEFSYPILNRKARGALQLSDIKIDQTQLELQNKRQMVQTKVQQYANELQTLGTQASLFRDFVASYQALLDAENARFQFGESSIFLINSREQRLLDTQIKYLKLLCEYKKAEAGLIWALGIY